MLSKIFKRYLISGDCGAQGAGLHTAGEQLGGEAGGLEPKRPRRQGDLQYADFSNNAILYLVLILRRISPRCG